MRVFKTDYAYLPEGTQKYADYDPSVSNIVTAEYSHALNPQYHGNIFIEALPEPITNMEHVAKAYYKPLPPTMLRQTLPIPIRKSMVASLRDLRIPMEHHEMIEMEFHRAIRDSYAARYIICVENKSITVADDATASVTGFALLGRAGTGKTSSISTLVSRIPQVIRHKTEFASVVQITYLCVNCMPNNNMAGLFANIGAAVDKALGRIDRPYETMILKAASTANKLACVRRLIEEFSIGVIILDEIQHLSNSRTQEHSFEMLLQLNNTTKVAFVVVGTEEAYAKIFSSERMFRRVGTQIRVKGYLDDRDTFDNVISIIFQNQWFDEPVCLTSSMKDALFRYSDGIIDRMVTLCMYLNLEYLRYKEKNKPVTVDTAFLDKVITDKFPNLIVLATDCKTNKSIVEKELIFQNSRKKLEAELQGGQESSKEQLGSFLGRCVTSAPTDSMEDAVVQAISMCYDAYPEPMIRAAFREAASQNRTADQKTLTQKVITALKKQHKAQRRKPNKDEMSAAVMGAIQNLA